ncbi:MAG: GNAT family N-acetyltransferase [Candidatus Hydrogenedentes bacterium]|nr:GNAT family N-acetyltransferase [Candidatus Hydrogenedentota bacterium]
MNELHAHDVTLRGKRVTLRPMTEADWYILLPWQNDPEVLHYSEGDRVASRTLEDVQSIFRSTSQNAYCFIAEFEQKPVGECWLQRMNLPRILERYPREDLRRIDLAIGEKDLWGQGLGTEVIRLLVRFGFEQEQADRILGAGVMDFNVRSFRAFLRAGFEVDAVVRQPPGAKARYEYDMMLTRQKYTALKLDKRT